LTDDVLFPCLPRFPSCVSRLHLPLLSRNYGGFKSRARPKTPEPASFLCPPGPFRSCCRFLSRISKSPPRPLPPRKVVRCSGGGDKRQALGVRRVGFRKEQGPGGEPRVLVASHAPAQTRAIRPGQSRSAFTFKSPGDPQ